MRRLGTALTVVVAAALACDQPVQPPVFGAIVIGFAPPRAAPAPAPERGTGVRTGKHIPDEGADTLRASSGTQAAASLDSVGPELSILGRLTAAHITLTGPANRDDTVSLGGTGTTQARFDSLPVGSYIVKVEGLVNDTVDSYGQADGVQVNAGSATTVDLTSASSTFPFSPLRPTLQPLTSPTTAFTLPVRFSSVRTATGYQVQWSSSATFASGVQSKSVTDTTTTLSVADTGRYYVRAKATVSVTSNPRWSDTVSARVAASTTGGGNAGAPYTVRTGVSTVDTTLRGLNLYQGQPEDWFSLDACREDTLILETMAARLTPPSPLNTLLRLFQSDGVTQVAANDDIGSGNTDSRIQAPLPLDGTYKVQVTEAANTVGNYELRVTLRPGAQNIGTGCVPPGAASVELTPDTVQLTLVGDAVPLAAKARDAIGRLMTGVTFTWTSRSTGVATVNSTGQVTAAGNGTTYVLATADGHSDSTLVVVGPATVDVLPDTVHLGAVGDTAVLTASARNALGNLLAGVSFSWTTRNSAVATVNAAGKVTAAGNGTTYVVGATGGIPDSARIVVAQLASLSQSAVTVSAASIAAGSSLTLKLIAKDSHGNRLQGGGLTVAFSISGGTSAGTIGTVTDSANGAYTASFRGETAGTAATVGATINSGAVTSNLPTVTVTPGPAKKLAYQVQPGGGTAGQNIAPTIEVIAQDSFSNQVPSVSGAVTMSIGTNPAGGTLFGTVTKSFVTGVASFSDLKIDKAGNGYTLKAKAASLDSAISATFNVTEGAAKKVAFIVEPSNAGANANITPAIQVAIQDSLGNTATGATNPVTLSLLANPGGSTLSGTLNQNAQSGTGIATFNDINLDKIATGYRLLATSSGLSSDTSATFNITAGAPVRLSFTVEPSNATAGASIAPSIQVTVLDGGGNLATSASDTVTIAILNDPSGAATLSGTKKVVPSSGVAAFNNLSVNKAGTGYTLRVTSGSLTPDTSAAFNISAAAPYQLAFGVQPGVTASGDTITPHPTVRILDAFGNYDSSATNVVTMAIGANPGSGTLSGTTNRAAAGGLATFNDLKINAAGVGYTLAATSTSLLGATSDTFRIIASATVDSLQSSAVASPSTGLRVRADTATITVTVRDAGGNPIPGKTVQLSASGPDTIIIQPASTTNGSGVATGKITSRKAATKTVTVTVNPGGSQVVLAQHPTVAFVADTGAVSASASTATAAPDTVFADGVQQATITVTVQDTLGNLVSGRGVQLATTGAGTLTQPGPTNGSGVTTGAIKRSTAGSDTIRVKVNPGEADSVVLSQRPVVVFIADTLSLDVDSSTVVVTYSGATGGDTAIADGSDPATVTVTVKNHSGTAIAGDSVWFAVSGTGNSFTQPAGLTLADGIKTTAIRSTTAEVKTVTVTVKQGSNTRELAAHPAIRFKAGAPAGLGFKVQPSNGTAGTALSPSVQVAVVDTHGNTVTDDTRQIKVRFVANPTATTLLGDTLVTAVGGVATFSNLAIQAASTGYTLRAVDAGTMIDSIVSNSFDIAAAGATQLAFKLQPTNDTAGVSIAPAVEVKVMDQYGNTVTSATNAVTVAIAATPDTSAVLSGTKTRNAVAGVASFNNLSINKTGIGYKLGATASGLDGDTSTTFNITAAAAAKLKFTTQPTNDTAGSAISAVQVMVQDAFGNTVTTDVGNVTIAIADDPSGGIAILSGTNPKAAVAGVATFNDLSIDRAGVNYSLVATRGGLTQDFSLHFNIAAAAAAQLAFTVQPAVTTAGAAISPAVKVTARDAFGNTATSFTDTVTVAIANDPSGSATLSGTKKVAAVSGVATFSTLNINKVGTGYTLSANATGLTGTTSNPFNITVAGAAKVAFVHEPSATAAGSYISPAVQVAVQDQFGNTLTGATNAVSLAILNNPVGGALLGPTTKSAVSGVATFDSITVDKMAAGYTLLATATSLASDTSAAFNVTAGSPDSSTSSVTANPTSGVLADSVQTSTITVVVRDQYSNPVSGQSVTLASTGSNNTITQPAGATDGTGTTTGTIATTSAETKTITATVGGTLALHQRPTVTFVADTGISATQSLVAVSPGTVVADGAATATVTITVKDKFGNPVGGKTATIALSGTGNTVTQPSAPSNGSGVTSGTIASTKAESKTVIVTVDGKTLLQQPIVVFQAGLPARLGFVVQPTAAASFASIAPAVQVAVQDAQRNTVDTATDAISLALMGGTPGSHLFSTLPVTAVSGIATFTDLKVDSVGTGYQLQATAGGLTADTSVTFEVTPGAIYTITVTPSADSIFALGGTSQLAATARDSAGNLVPSATFVWASTNNPVATVDGSGLVTAHTRGLANITATSNAKIGTANLAVAVRVAGIGNSFGSAPGQIFSSGDLPGTFTTLTPAAFNAFATAADLRAQFDVLLFVSTSDASANADWATRLRPYLGLGGGVVFEDPTNVGDLAPIITGTAHDTTGGIVNLEVPNLSNGITSNFAASHIGYSAWSDSIAHFLVLGDTALGLYGRFGNACLVATGTAQATDGLRGGTATQNNQYQLLLHEVRFAADCPLNASPGPAQTVRVLPKSHAFTNITQTTTPRATALDSLGTPIPNHTFTWSSTNDTIATVNSSTGEVTSARDGQVAIKALGSGEDYALMTVGVPAGTVLNAWGTEVAPGLLQPSFFSASWGTSVSNFYLAGDGGQVRHYNGVAWDTVASGTGNWLWDAWGSSGNDVYIVGTIGTILHYNGSTWGLIPIGGAEGSQSYYGVWGSAPNDVFVVGTGGVILHYDGNAWQPMPNPASGVADLYGVWGTSARNVWAVGSGVILHYDGATWTPVSNPLPGQPLFRVWGSSESNVFAVSIGGSDIAHFDGSSWGTQTNPTPGIPFYDLFGTSSTEVFAVGGSGTILKYNGSSWSRMASPTAGYVLTVWGTADGQLRAAGQSGEVWHGIRGASIASVAVSPSARTISGVASNFTFTGIARDGSGNVVTPAAPPTWTSLNTGVASVDGGGTASAAGSGQTPISFSADGVGPTYATVTVVTPGATPVTAWDSTASPTTSWLWGMWGTSASDIYASGASGAGQIIRYNGSSWSATTSPLGVGNVRSLWGSSATDLWAVTDGGYILSSSTGTNWTTAASGLASLYGIWGSAPNDIWAVGTGGNVYRYGGSSWALQGTVPGGALLLSVWGSASDSIFAVGSGKIFRYVGATWDSIPIASLGIGAPTFYRVWGISSTDFFVVGTGGTILRCNGRAASCAAMASGTTAALYGVWGSSGDDVYAVGSTLGGVGTILRFNGAVWSPQVSTTTQPVYSVWGTNAGTVWAGAAAGNIRRGVRGGVLTATPQISFAAPNINTKMNIASNGATYHYANGGNAATGKLYEYNLAGAFVDSNAVTGIDQRSILYRAGTYYLKSYGSNWYTVDPQTGVTALVFGAGFANVQSVPAVSLLGAVEIWEFTGGTIRRLNSSTGALINTVTGVIGSNAIATDGYYLYTQSGTTIYVYSASAISLSNTAQLVGTFTVPNGTSTWSLSFANGMLFTSDGSTWYGYRLGVTP